MSWIREGNHDKAWNDPPVFSYDTASAAQATQKRTSLNKRVAFPLSGTAASPVMPGQGPPPVMPGQGPPPLMPGQGPPPAMPGQGPPPLIPGQGPPPVMPGQGPPPVIPIQGPPPVMPGQGRPPMSGMPRWSSDNKEQADARTPILSGVEIKTNLLTILNGLEKIEEKLKDDIVLRVEVLSRIWDADQFSKPVRVSVHQLVKALQAGAPAEADRLQRGLAVDYPAECAAWLPGVRQLIAHLDASPAGTETTAAAPDGQVGDAGAVTDATDKATDATGAARDSMDKATDVTDTATDTTGAATDTTDAATDTTDAATGATGAATGATGAATGATGAATGATGAATDDTDTATDTTGAATDTTGAATDDTDTATDDTDTATDTTGAATDPDVGS